MQYQVMAKDFSGVTVVGCGGTGGFVAEGLCRLLPRDSVLLLVDHDRVEPHNLRRQAFFAGDVGKFKSQALAERLAQNYGRKVGYSVCPYAAQMLRGSEVSSFRHVVSQGLIIGCVDNPHARLEIAGGLNRNFGSWWLDAGNSRHSGQVLLGNTMDVFAMAKSFHPQDQTVHALPMPSLQAPALVAPLSTAARPRDCAQEVQDEEQSPVINQAMATLVLEFVHRMLTRSLFWMGAYLDLDAGTLQTVPATPEAVARVTGLDTDTLTDFGCGQHDAMKPTRRRSLRNVA